MKWFTCQRKRFSFLGLIPVIWTLSAFPQIGARLSGAVEKSGQASGQMGDWQSFGRTDLTSLNSETEPTATVTPPDVCESRNGQMPESQNVAVNGAGADSTSRATDQRLVAATPKVNQEIYYKHKFEFSLEGGWLPINIPFPLDLFTGDSYNTYPLKYTLVPMFASLRWQMSKVRGPWWLRGSWDSTFTGSVTEIPRGAETHYYSYIMGIRRNFVPRKETIAPYWDVRAGLGMTDARGPKGVKYGQGQDFTFTLNSGAGVRYNFNPRYAISAGVNWMHISNANLSQHHGPPNYGTRNYGINVLGPMIGIDISLRRHHDYSP